MKHRNALTLAALAGIMSLSFAASAQQWGKQTDQKDRQSNQSRTDTRNSDKNRNAGSQDRGNQNKGDSGSSQGRGGVDRGKGSDWQNNDRGGQQQSGHNDHKQIQPPVHQNDRNGQDWQRNQDQQRRDQQNRGNDWRDSSRDKNWNQGHNSDSRNNSRGQNWNQGHDYDSRNNDRGQNWNRGHDYDSHDEWRFLISTFGFLTDLNRLERDDTLYFDGDYGSYYPVYEYEQDCRSSNRLARARADFFARTFFIRDGHRFDRRVVTNHGERCYQFVRAW